MSGFFESHSNLYIDFYVEHNLRDWNFFFFFALSLNEVAISVYIKSVLNAISKLVEVTCSNGRKNS